MEFRIKVNQDFLLCTSISLACPFASRGNCLTTKTKKKKTYQKPNLLQRLPEDSSSDDDSPFDAYYETSDGDDGPKK